MNITADKEERRAILLLLGWLPFSVPGNRPPREWWQRPGTDEHWTLDNAYAYVAMMADLNHAERVQTREA